eukprot:scaffold5829_cov129-Skeletonema_marinoi.AAC.5
MPSKKKTSRGRARKGRNNRKKKNEGEQQQGPLELDTQMERLKIGDESEASFLDEAIKLAAAEKEALESRAVEEEKSFTIDTRQSHTIQCYHGYVPGEDHFIINEFVKTFVSGFNSLWGETYVGETINVAHQATRKIHPEVGNDYFKMKMVLTLFLFQGTQAVLEGRISDARSFAAVAFYLEDYITFYFEDGANDVFDAARQIELLIADQHTLVKYLRKNIPCSCLDEKYKQVKSITKMGFCCNENCSLPSRMAERSTMVYCTRCRTVNYCSRKCQKAAWPKHKSHCDKHAKARTGLDSRK